MRITEANMDRFVNQSLDVLLEERFDGDSDNAEHEDLWLGRLYCHAPEVDGAAVIAGAMPGTEKAGDVLPCKVIARRGFDLEVRLIS